VPKKKSRALEVIRAAPRKKGEKKTHAAMKKHGRCQLKSGGAAGVPCSPCKRTKKKETNLRGATANGWLTSGNHHAGRNGFHVGQSHQAKGTRNEQSWTQRKDRKKTIPRIQFFKMLKPPGKEESKREKEIGASKPRPKNNLKLRIVGLVREKNQNFWAALQKAFPNLV